MAAVTQVRHRHSEGRAYYDKKLAEGKTPKEAMRSLKRQVSNAIYTRLQADARRGAARRRPQSATRKAPGQDPQARTQHPKGTSHPAKKGNGNP